MSRKMVKFNKLFPTNPYLANSYYKTVKAKYYYSFYVDDISIFLRHKLNKKQIMICIT